MSTPECVRRRVDCFAAFEYCVNKNKYKSLNPYLRALVWIYMCSSLIYRFIRNESRSQLQSSIQNETLDTHTASRSLFRYLNERLFLLFHLMFHCLCGGIGPARTASLFIRKNNTQRETKQFHFCWQHCAVRARCIINAMAKTCFDTGPTIQNDFWQFSDQRIATIVRRLVEMRTLALESPSIAHTQRNRLYTKNRSHSKPFAMHIKMPINFRPNGKFVSVRFSEIFKIDWFTTQRNNGQTMHGPNTVLDGEWLLTIAIQ